MDVAREHIGWRRQNGAKLSEVAAEVGVPAQSWDQLTLAYAKLYYELQQRRILK
jgi:hypothetical protein